MVDLPNIPLKDVGGLWPHIPFFGGDEGNFISVLAGHQKSVPGEFLYNRIFTMTRRKEGRECFI